MRWACGGEGWSLWQRLPISQQDGVEPTGAELTHNEETPESSWLLQDTRERAWEKQR